MTSARPLIAITRGIKPEEAGDIALAFMQAGISDIEVPLNSPDPFTSIKNMIAAVGDKARIGAGTVLTIDEVNQLKAVGGQFVVSPNTDIDIIMHSKKCEMHSYPGCFTATECFAAIKAGADGLKLFPAFMAGTQGVKALCAVLPKNMPLFAVGGVSENDFEAYLKAGCSGFGLGSSVYKPGMSAEEVSRRAQNVVTIYDSVTTS